MQSGKPLSEGPGKLCSFAGGAHTKTQVGKGKPGGESDACGAKRPC